MKKEKYLFLKTEKWIYFIAIMVTFIICGIWHGEGWTYIIWGCLFGIYLTYSNWTQSLQKKFRKKFHIDKKSGGYIFYKITITFILVTFAWIFFRAASLVTAFSIIEKIFTMPGQVYVGETQQFLYGIIGIMMLMILEFFQERSKPFLFSFTKKHWLIEQFSYSLLIVIILMIGVFDGGQFIYFQF